MLRLKLICENLRVTRWGEDGIIKVRYILRI